jgi:hypothetical protein
LLLPSCIYKEVHCNFRGGSVYSYLGVRSFSESPWNHLIFLK